MDLMDKIKKRCGICNKTFEFYISRKDTARFCSIKCKGLASRGKVSANFQHGMKGTRFYLIWTNMKRRCLNPNNKSYKDYGGRGINVCNEWINFENFKNDLYDSYVSHSQEHGEKNTFIDRIDNNGNYVFENIRWVDRKQQNSNKRMFKLSREKT